MMSDNPVFATLTGCNRADAVEGMQALSRQFPNRVEFGVLINEEKFGQDRFPDLEAIDALRRSGLRLAAHLCGSFATDVFVGRDIALDLAGFSRIQINLVGRPATLPEIENAVQFGRMRGVRTILQCAGEYPDDTRCDWLLDSSFGTGRPVRDIPDMRKTHAFCGVSGGLGASTIAQTLNDLKDVNVPFWIDAESSLFEGDNFSTELCRDFLAQTFTQ